ncbi:2-oxo acid dehydrogenase subunit E2, partial [Mammaliicoccus vitulinus]
PVVVNDMIGIRDMVNLSLSIDHRILDGLMAGEFLKFVKERLQSMTIENTSIY